MQSVATVNSLAAPGSPIQPKHILIGGGSGFIGRELTAKLRAQGDRVTWVSRFPGDGRITWDQVKTRGLPNCDVVINLAGKHILDMRRRWGSKYRDEVLRSRIDTTMTLVKAINSHSSPPAVFISTAGKCFYGSQAFCTPEEYADLDERCEPVGVDYPARLVRLWEDAADEIDTNKVRHVKLRLGIVLATEGRSDTATAKSFDASRGIFPMLHRLFKHGLGAVMGSGVQPFPWVHIDDAVGIFRRAIDHPELSGIYNVVSPGIVSNREFSELLALKVGRTRLWRLPAAIIKAVVGLDRSTILLLGQRIKPQRTLESGYRFCYPDLESCLANLVSETMSGDR